MEDGMFDCPNCVYDGQMLFSCRHCKPGIHHGSNFASIAFPKIDWQARALAAEAALVPFADMFSDHCGRDIYNKGDHFKAAYNVIKAIEGQANA